MASSALRCNLKYSTTLRTKHTYPVTAPRLGGDAEGGSCSIIPGPAPLPPPSRSFFLDARGDRACCPAMRSREGGEGGGGASLPRTCTGGAVSPLLQLPVELLKLGPLQRAWRGHVRRRQGRFHYGNGHLGRTLPRTCDGLRAAPPAAAAAAAAAATDEGSWPAPFGVIFAARVRSAVRRRHCLECEAPR